MTETPLEHRKVLVHHIQQLDEVHEDPRVTRVQSSLPDPQHPRRHPPVLPKPPLHLEAQFLLLRKHHTKYAYTCETLKRYVCA